MEVSFKIHVEQLGNRLFRAHCPELLEVEPELGNTEDEAATAFAFSEAFTAAVESRLEYQRGIQ